MQTGRNDMKKVKGVSMHSHAFERPYKRQIVSDTKSRNASHVEYFHGSTNSCYHRNVVFLTYNVYARFRDIYSSLMTQKTEFMFLYSFCGLKYTFVVKME